MKRYPLLLLPLLLHAPLALAKPGACAAGVVFEDRNGNGRQDAGEPGLADVALSDGVQLVRTDARGHYRLAVEPGRTVFVIKPLGFSFAPRADGLPGFWRHPPQPAQPSLRYGGIVAEVHAGRGCDFALEAQALDEREALQVVLLSDSQPKSLADVGHFGRGIIDPLLAHGPQPVADLALNMGDVVDDALNLYPALLAQSTRLGVPWLHVPGNHDLDFDAADDAGSLQTWRNTFGPDTLAWEEPEASFVMLDNVIYQPGQRPAYIGGFREEQFTFLENYLRDARRGKLLVLGMHVPLFESEGRDTFRDADRERLFALLQPFQQVLLLSGHLHTQQHVLHGPDTGWHGAQPMHEYNIGAASGAFWSGVKDANGVPLSTMSDGTPRGWARLVVDAGGGYALSWHPAHDPDAAMHLHAPRVLRQGAYPAHAVYANVYMGMADTTVQYRIGDGPWQSMQRVERADPALLVENMRDDLAPELRGYDRSPEATASAHLWRGRLPTDLAVGGHRIEVRAMDPWRGEVRAETAYRLEQAEP